MPKSFPVGFIRCSRVNVVENQVRLFQLPAITNYIWYVQGIGLPKQIQATGFGRKQIGLPIRSWL